MDDWECAGCGSAVRLADEHEKPEHGLCWPCASDALDAWKSRAEVAESVIESFARKARSRVWTGDKRDYEWALSHFPPYPQPRTGGGVDE